MINRKPKIKEANSKEALQKRIEETAYDLYLRRGGQHGNDLDDWLKAERAVLTQNK